jgi:hypothetical protein
MFGSSSDDDVDQASSTPADTRPVVDPDSQPTASPTEKPEVPAVAAEQSEEGAEATASYLLDSYAYMMATGDSSVWEERIDQNCQICVSFLANASQIHSQGGYQVGGEFTVQDVQFEGAGDPPSSGTATLQVTQAPAQIVDDPEREAVDVPAFDGTMQLQLNWNGSQWVIGDMALVDAAEGGASDEGGGA